MIKKILAVMLAASTIMTMSGLVMAGPNDPNDGKPKKIVGKKRLRNDEENESDEEESQEGKKLKIGEDQYIKINQGEKEKKNSDEKDKQPKEEKKVKSDDGALDEVDIQQSSLISRFNDLFRQDFKDDSERMEFADVVRGLSNCDFFNKYSNLEIKKLMQKLIQCLKLNSDKVKSDVSQTMISITVKCNLKEGNINDMLKILNLCSQTDNNKAKLNVVNAISTVVDGGLRDKFNNQQINSLVAILNCCLNAADEETAKCAAKVTETMLLNGVGDESVSQQIDDMLKIWRKCLVFPGARQSVVVAAARMIKTKLIGKFKNQQVNDLIEILAGCSETADQGLKQKITLFVALMARDASLSMQQIQTLSKILNQCVVTSETSSVKQFAAKAIHNLIRRALVDGTFHRGGLGDEFEKELIKDLTSQLIICSDSAEAQKYVIWAIGLMVEHSLLIGYGKEQLVELSNMLVGWSNNFHVKSDVAWAIGLLAYGGLVRGGFFAGFDKEQRLELTKALINCSENPAAKANVARAIGQIISRELLLRGYDEKELSELEAALISCADEYDAKPYVASDISILANEGWFCGCDKKQMFDIVDVLRSCLKNAKAKKGVAKAIGYLTYYGCFKDFSKDEFEDILSLFKSCVKEN